MKLMSFRFTLPQLLLGMKSVTRRAGWIDLRARTPLMAVDQVMGLEAGQRPIKVCPIFVTSVRREPLDAITDEEAAMEGFPGKTGEEFASMFAKTVSSSDGTVTRIGFRPLEFDGIPACGTRVNVLNCRQRRKRGAGLAEASGVVIAHVRPGDDPVPLGALIKKVLSLPGTYGRWRPKNIPMAMVLKESGRLTAAPAKGLLEPTRSTIAADIVFEHTVSARIRKMAIAAQEVARHGVSACCLLAGGD